MARLTDQIKDRIASDPMRKIKQNQDAPEWLSGPGIWVGMAVVAAGLAFVIFMGVNNNGPEEPAPVAEQATQDPQQQVNPNESGEDEEPSDNGGEASEEPTDAESSPTDSEDDGQGDLAAKDFTALDNVTLPVETSSLDSQAPAGAVNVGKAGAEALTTGDWSDIPTNRSPVEDRYLGTQIDWDTFRLADPVPEDADASKAFTFLVDGVADDGSAVQFSVTAKWADDTYEVVIF